MGAQQSKEELARSLQEGGYHVIRPIGKGAWGRVWLVQEESSGQVWAVKGLPRAALVAERLEEHTLLERQVMQVCGGEPFLITLHRSLCSEEWLYMVLDWVVGGSLWSYLCAQPDTHLSEAATRFYCAEMIVGVAQLHRRGFVYRDLKPHNLLIDQEGHLVLTDFGLSHRVRGSERLHSFSGSSLYIAPEVLLEAGHGKEVDWWALGIVIHILLTGTPPFWSDNRKELFEMIRHAPLQLDHPYLSESARHLIQQLLVRDPRARLGAGGATEIQAHPFFRTIDWGAVKRKELRPPYIPSAESWQQACHRSPEEPPDPDVQRQLTLLQTWLRGDAHTSGEDMEDDPFAHWDDMPETPRGTSGRGYKLMRSFTMERMKKRKPPAEGAEKASTSEKVQLAPSPSVTGPEKVTKKKKEKPPPGRRGHRRAFSIDALNSISDKIEGVIRSDKDKEKEKEKDKEKDKRAPDPTPSPSSQCALCQTTLTPSQVRCPTCRRMVCRSCCVRGMVREGEAWTAQNFCRACAPPQTGGEEGQEGVYEYYCHDGVIARANLGQQTFSQRLPDGSWVPLQDPVLVDKMKQGRGALPSAAIAEQLFQELVAHPRSL